MLKVGTLKPFKLKTTNGNILAYYGNCTINLTAMPFRDMKKANKEQVPFVSELSDFLYRHNNTKRIKTTTHILTMSSRALVGDYDSYITVKPPDTNLTGNGGETNPTISIIPNLNEEETNIHIKSFIDSIKNPQLKKSLQMIFYNLTHGETPYANVDYQTDTYYENNFALYSNQPDHPLDRSTLPYSSGVNGYPQNALIFVPQDWFTPLNYPHFYYNTEFTTRVIDTNAAYNTLPYHGICGLSQTTVYFYWTTYKGV